MVLECPADTALLARVVDIHARLGFAPAAMTVAVEGARMRVTIDTAALTAHEAGRLAALTGRIVGMTVRTCRPEAGAEAGPEAGAGAGDDAARCPGLAASG